MAIVQMVTSDHVGGETLPVEVKVPITKESLIAAAAKKFKAVTKQSRAYHGLTGDELIGEVTREDVIGAFVVLSGKAGWKGAVRLSATAEQLVDASAMQSGATTVVAVARASKTSASAPTPDQLLEASRSNRTDGVVLCWKETQNNGYLSNWAKSQIVIDDTKYNCVEQWMMACKALACGDVSVLEQIMKSKSPRKQKCLGRSLNSKNVQRCWKLSDKWMAQLRGVRAKFQQNDALALKLLRTGGKLIAEASPSDVIFGIGLAPDDPLAQDPSNWKGQNLLGKALMQIRAELRRQTLLQYGGEEAPIVDPEPDPLLEFELADVDLECSSDYDHLLPSSSDFD